MERQRIGKSFGQMLVVTASKLFLMEAIITAWCLSEGIYELHNTSLFCNNKKLLEKKKVVVLNYIKSSQKYDIIMLSP